MVGSIVGIGEGSEVVGFAVVGDEVVGVPVVGDEVESVGVRV